MFNDLNNQANPNRQEVDDIFAETDKPAASGNSSDIQIRNVGLASMGGDAPQAEDGPTADKRNYLKLIIIITLSLAIIGGAYLVYSKFLKGSGDSNLEPIANNQGTEVTTVGSEEIGTKTENTTPKPVENNFVDSIPGIDIASVTPIQTATSSETDNTVPAITEVATATVSTIDSDSDSLTDEEEKSAGTNINVIDTDNDGLSDYEEVKIYRTNPLSADTDGDGYLDGSEVKNGYNPNGAGKLSGNSEVK